MDLTFSPEESAFRKEVRSFVKKKLPANIRDKVMNGVHLTRDDHVQWQKTLYARGWGGPGWPMEFGGPGWTPCELYIFEEECAATGAIDATLDVGFTVLCFEAVGIAWQTCCCIWNRHA